MGLVDIRSAVSSLLPSAGMAVSRLQFIFSLGKILQVGWLVSSNDVDYSVVLYTAGCEYSGVFKL